ncbi:MULTISPECIES: hypothetical protein [Ponticoccus]|uniref:Uncharacterized protein n=1 Tax=Ponticoccus litoralis TaxID=422297 RepID=A0AAW9SPQ3_9RHOB
MSAFFDFMLSPAGLAAYAAFWAFKLTLGAWLLRRAMRLVPVHVREGWRSRMPGWRLLRRGRLP